MEEKKNLKVKLVAILLVVVIAVIVCVFSLNGARENNLVKKYISEEYYQNCKILDKYEYTKEDDTKVKCYIVTIENDKYTPFVVEYDESLGIYSNNYSCLLEGEKILNDNYIDSMNLGNNVAIMESENSFNKLVIVIEVGPKTEKEDILEKLKSIKYHYNNPYMLVFFCRNLNENVQEKMHLAGYLGEHEINKKNNRYSKGLDMRDDEQELLKMLDSTFNKLK